MICDAHVHVGYYSRKGLREPQYYSPRRVIGVLNRHNVDDFVVSSTCAQVQEIGTKAMLREAREVKRLVGGRAHMFFWISGHLYDEDPKMKWLDFSMFEGIKLHEDETPWMKNRRDDLYKILLMAKARGLPVMFHAGLNEGCKPMELAEVAKEFSTLRFNFAHCRPMEEMARVVAECPNVWTDTAYMSLENIPKLREYDWRGRLMFGTDVPVWQAHEKTSLDKMYGEYIKAIKLSGLEDATFAAFNSFIKQKR